MARRYAGDVRWGWTCPRCNAETTVTRDPSSETFRWECDREDCETLGFGFRSRRAARIALRESAEECRDVYR
ncbi:hypothetical protein CHINAEXTREME_08515 [Halobiforma lacisalsi AJ5]|uniref:Uncharacterized protein n=1 Tax=Natronobacterium lacisalsi AJ5 TaxID=358396 RepID=M0LWA3_NATLA|nr:hypothetical protein [Halobiforma lacisalsi]APW97818.1 hypothetical protein CHINAEXTREME_08515 [Halobiforma lacisalsi AJ5]EMA37433.1 hypothetical protein C445_01051 [Halobiforma lacisalsi AJ5]